jgi:hypothetical protein
MISDSICALCWRNSSVRCGRSAPSWVSRTNSVTSSDAVDDVGEAAIGREQRRVDRAPVADLEPAALNLGPTDVVFLHSHGVGHQMAADPVQRGPQVALAGGGGLVGVIRVSLASGIRP